VVILMGIKLWTSLVRQCRIYLG